MELSITSSLTFDNEKSTSKQLEYESNADNLSSKSPRICANLSMESVEMKSPLLDQQENRLDDSDSESDIENTSFKTPRSALDDVSSDSSDE